MKGAEERGHKGQKEGRKDKRNKDETVERQIRVKHGRMWFRGDTAYLLLTPDPVSPAGEVEVGLNKPGTLLGKVETTCTSCSF